MIQYKDRVWEIITNPDSSTIITLSNTPKDATYKTVAASFQPGDEFYYLISSTIAWEVGLGTYLGSNQFSRDIVLSNSAGTQVKIAFSSGSHNLINTVPSDNVQNLMAYLNTFSQQHSSHFFY
jgi:hypothetical protein